jgi:repressor LexA
LGNAGAFFKETDVISRREQDTHDFIRRYVDQHGHAPLLDEIAAGLGISSRGVAHRYVQAIAREGLIELISGRHRGIRLTSPTKDSGTTLPVLGRIAAGHPIEAIPDQTEVNLADFLMGPGRFVLKVQGDSMIEAGILDKDMVVVESRSDARDGEIVVALVDNDEATLKRLKRNSDGSVTLLPANRHLAPVTYSPERIRIQGVVVAQMRSYR